MSLAVSDVLSAVEQFALPELESFLEGLCPCLPVAALIKLADQVAREIAARNELDAMRAAVRGADASVDAAEQAALEASDGPTGG